MPLRLLALLLIASFAVAFGFTDLAGISKIVLSISIILFLSNEIAGRRRI